MSEGLRQVFNQGKLLFFLSGEGKKVVELCTYKDKTVVGIVKVLR